MMKLKLWPRSLLGQMLLSVAAALLVAQAISGILLWRAQEQRREELLMNAAAFRLVAPPMEDLDHRHGVPKRGFDPFRIRLEHSASFTVKPNDTRYEGREKRLREILLREGFVVNDIRVVTHQIEDDPLALESLRERRHFRDNVTLGERELLVAALQAQPSGEWSIARIPMRVREPQAPSGILLQTLVLYIVLVGGLALLLRRITRPLAALTARMEGFTRAREFAGQLEPSGPDDTRRLIEAHNAMEGRVAALLDEKDVMLGAIGHDLKTPLAALRVRIETVDNETERARMATTIEDIARTLDDILSLARVGRPSDQPENTELSALTASVVEEFEDLGENVTLGETSRIALTVRTTWLRRALRNLVANALRYAGNARVSLQRENGHVTFRVEDDGPGIPEDEIEAMLEPFKRGEASRSRETGGAGLGLTLARAIAEQHGGSLHLTNRRAADGTTHGLAAELRLPLD
jgi:signal transduction histidine kinase